MAALIAMAAIFIFKRSFFYKKNSKISVFNLFLCNNDILR